MSGSRIKGITVEIGGDTTKLQTALKGVNSEIKNTQAQILEAEVGNDGIYAIFEFQWYGPSTAGFL